MLFLQACYFFQRAISKTIACFRYQSFILYTKQPYYYLQLQCKVSHQRAHCKYWVFQHPYLGCYIELTITHPSKVTELLYVEFSNNIMQCFIEHLMCFKNSLRDATNIPFGVTDGQLVQIMCNKIYKYKKMSSLQSNK